MNKQIRTFENEKKLFLSAMQGDRTTLQYLFEQNKSKIYSIAYHYTQKKEDAEDISQETLVKAFNGIQKKKIYSFAHFTSWLTRIVVNHAIDFLRKKKKRQELFKQDIFDINIKEDSGQLPEEKLLHQQSISEIHQSLKILSDNQRMMFILKYYHQQKIKEIAETFRCSEGSVKKQLSRSSAKIKQFIFKKEGEK